MSDDTIKTIKKYAETNQLIVDATLEMYKSLELASVGDPQEFATIGDVVLYACRKDHLKPIKAITETEESDCE